MTHTIDAISFAIGQIDCACGALVTGPAHAPYALADAWLAHRREAAGLPPVDVARTGRPRHLPLLRDRRQDGAA